MWLRQACFGCCVKAVYTLYGTWEYLQRLCRHDCKSSSLHHIISRHDLPRLCVGAPHFVWIPCSWFNVISRQLSAGLPEILWSFSGGKRGQEIFLASVDALLPFNTFFSCVMELVWPFITWYLKSIFLHLFQILLGLNSSHIYWSLCNDYLISAYCLGMSFPSYTVHWHDKTSLTISSGITCLWHIMITGKTKSWMSFATLKLFIFTEVLVWFFSCTAKFTCSYEETFFSMHTLPGNPS